MRAWRRLLVQVMLLLVACDGGRDGGAARAPAEAEGGAWVRVAQAGKPFRDHWYDGRAELSGYRITTSRYGELRDGELALIYVTEPHDRRSWLKVDAKDVPTGERVNVMKLNASLSFQTGIYPYRVLTSVFSPVDDFGGERFRPARLTQGVQEWCGHVYHAVMPGEAGFRYRIASYFDSEGEGEGVISAPEGVLYEDALLVQLRELDGSFHQGEDFDGTLIPSLWRLRREHEPPKPVRATVTRSDADRGGVPVTRFVLSAGGYTRTIDVEKASPRRVLGWSTSDGEVAEILETTRLAYWELNGEGDEVAREKMGL